MVVAVNSRLPVAEDSLTRVVILSITNGAALPSPTALAITHALLLRAARYSLKVPFGWLALVLGNPLCVFFLQTLSSSRSLLDV